MFKKFLVVSCLLLSGVALAAWWQYQNFLESPLRMTSDTQIFTIEKGWSGRRLGKELVKSGILSSTPWFDVYMRVSGHSSKLQAGEYELVSGMTLPQAVSLFVSGDVTQYRFTIIEGWTVKDLRRQLANSPNVVQTLNEISNEEIMRRLGKADTHPEGQFLPDTYKFPRGMTDFDLLKKSHVALHETLDDEWSDRAKDIRLKTPYEALILASIIEKETAVASERQQISGVFSLRLSKAMKLQTDPTVIYGMGESYKGNIRRRDLTTDTPYNTYTRKGLPPSPIALAGKDSIHAALHPKKGKDLYFVSRGNGTHKFSATLEEHNAAVRKYQLKK